MVLTNLTEDEKYKSYGEQACSPQITEGIHNQLICLSVINVFLSITAFLGNTLILVALHKESSLHAPSKVFLRTLAITDLCVCIAEPLSVTTWMSAVQEQWIVCRFAYAAAFTAAFIFCSVSLLTLTAISVDRLLALSLGLRYRQVVTLKRAYVTVTVFWVLPIVYTFMSYFNHLIALWFATIGLPLCLIISFFSYAKIFFILCQNQVQVQNHVHQGQPSQTVPLNIPRYRKTVSSALLVQLALVVCYRPHCIALAFVAQKGITSSLFLTSQLTVTFVYLNSSLNPILYCWKIREVK